MHAEHMSWPTVDRLPPRPVDPRFRLEPLGPEHNERDHVAWMSSIDHIHATPGFEPGHIEGDDQWPFAMTLERNLEDLEMHAAEFAAAEAYAYSVIEPQTDDVIGCVYIDPDRQAHGDGAACAVVKSWVRADRADLDRPLAASVATWLMESAAFRSIRWPGRPQLDSSRDTD
ncbi:MAG: hypothetical protein JWN99_3319 [Ilumatobacteraceae bacterium]|nr:hypothetical protein [Ilumatobacteraceae bacterium]